MRYAASRRLLLGLILWGAVIAPLARPHRVEAVGPVGVVLVACGARPVLCVQIGSVLLGTLIVAGNAVSDGTVDEILDAFIDWYDGLSGDDLAQWEARVGGGGTYIALDSYTAGEIEDMVAALIGEGFTSFSHAGIDGGAATTHYRLGPKDLTGLGYSSGDTVYTATLELAPAGGGGNPAGCTGGSNNIVRIQTGGNVNSINTTAVRVERVDTGAQISSTSVNNNSIGGSEQYFEHTMATGSNCTDVASQGRRVEIDFRVYNGGGFTTERQTQFGAAFGEVKWCLGNSCNAGSAGTYYAATLYTADFATPLYDTAGVPTSGRFRIPANTDDLVNQTGNPTFVGVDGEVGPGYVAGAASPTGSLTDEANAAWWEGLFGGVVGALGSIWSKLNSMSGTLTSIYDWVTDFPTHLTSALTTAFTPTDAMSARLAANMAYWASLPPFSIPGTLFGYVSDVAALFSGAGTPMCFEFEFRDLLAEEYCAADMAADVAPVPSVSRAASVVFVGMTVVLYLMGWYRRFFEGE